jgi:DNA modification methylase
VTVRILEGDCRAVLPTLPDESVHVVVTSPPYYALRDYGVDGQIGLERSPEDYVAEMVAVFREVRRVLRADGTLWLNIGDSYATNGGAGWQGKNGQRADRRFTAARDSVGLRDCNRRPPHGVKAKGLVGIPWRVAFALQADGWNLRQDIIWSKPNPMPESVRDRCTKAHEYLFLLSKSSRYYYDADAIAEPLGAASIARLQQRGLDDQADSERVPGKTNGAMKAVGKRRAPGNVSHKGTAAHVNGDEFHRTKSGLVAFAERERAKVEADLVGTRNKRSVWEVATQPFKEAHFATFPPALVEPCVLAGSPLGGTVLDPFGGAGTTGLVADRLQRDAILIELNPEYAAIARRRIAPDSPLFAQVGT